jgi:hypothetical protein
MQNNQKFTFYQRIVPRGTIMAQTAVVPRGTM